jgi:soluble lytic murein transglycosylase-like protein
MKGIYRAGGAFLVVLVLAATLLVSVVLGAVSGAQAGAATSPVSCAGPLPSAALAEGKVPAGYVAALQNASKVSGIPAPILAGQLRQESNFNPKAVSHAGARGIAQFMPGTWASYGQGKDPFDPLAGIDAQGRFLAGLLKQAQSSGFAGDPIDLALAVADPRSGHELGDASSAGLGDSFWVEVALLPELASEYWCRDS